ncbi:MAG: hypothetical protein ACJ0KI_05380 [Dehalococcoidia bacterium]|tara:strand:+ start:12972 stop:13295 length:324 start_codon:yes stop_codon:yes gene_type:complete
MDKAQEDELLKFAEEHPDVLCKDAPLEVLEECSHDAEPTPFLESFFETGFKKWFIKKTGYDITPPRYEITNAILLLHFRANKMYTYHVLNEENPYSEQMFFSNEGLN